MSEIINEFTPFEGYFAQNQVSLNGLSENIFKELNDCGGLVVVMHARGDITTPVGHKVVRASVWIEQEIAIAAFIQKIQKREIKIILYAEKGISLEGVRSQLHLNPIEFDDNSEVEEHFKKYLSDPEFKAIFSNLKSGFICAQCEEKFDTKEGLQSHQNTTGHWDPLADNET